MKYVLSNGQVFFENKITKLDIEIENNIITKIAPTIFCENIIDCKGQLIIPGLVDLHVHSREPGYEYKETLSTLSNAALHGGFTDVIAMPNLNPVPNSSNIIRKIKNKAKFDTKMNFIQTGAITLNRDNKILNDFSDMKKETNFISDDGSGIENSLLMYEALLQAKKHDLTLLIHPEFLDFANNGSISISNFATKNNIKSIDPLAEELMIGRDLILNNRINAKLHFCHVSTKNGAELILKNGLKNTTFEVAPHHLVLSDLDLKNHGYYKMNPPLRSKDDVDYLVNLLKEGKLKIIATDHAPHSQNEKDCSLEDSSFGIIGCESAFPILYTKLVMDNRVPLVNLVEALTINPAKIINKNNNIEVGNIANIAIFDISNEYTFNNSLIGSKSMNSPFLNEKLFGVCMKTIVNGKIEYEVNYEN